MPENNEKRGPQRVNSKEIDAIYQATRETQETVGNMVKHLNATMEKITGHMEYEEKQRKLDVEELREQVHKAKGEIVGKLNIVEDIVESMPRDNHGNPSMYLHRVQHEEQSNIYGGVAKLKSKMLEKFVDFTVIALVVGALTNADKIIKLIS